jgi:hypothetical protein
VPSDISLDWSLWKERHDPETWRKVLELELAFAERLRQATERGHPLGPLPFWRTWNCASGDPSDRSGEVEDPSRGVRRRVFLIVQWSERPFISLDGGLQGRFRY